MILLNNREFEYFENMTVRKLIDKLKYSYPVLIVRVNKVLIDEAQFETTTIKDGDIVDIIHPICGG